MIARVATRGDCGAIAAIYNQGIEDRVATFETRLRSAENVAPWLDGRHPVVVVVECDDVIAFASTSTYRSRECYAGVAEASVYFARSWRRKGAGRGAVAALFEEARTVGFHKLVSRVFTENAASLRMIASMGFRKWEFTGGTASWMVCGEMS